MVYQIAKYMTYAQQSGRYIVAALDIQPETDAVLQKLGLETMVLNKSAILTLLSKEQNNPQLYQRVTTNALGQNTSRLKAQITTPLYSSDEQSLVKALMVDLERIIKENSELVRPFTIEGLDIRKSDQYRLLLRSSEFPTDRLLIYNRARKKDEIHLLYVPDFSFSTGNATQKKSDFVQYVVGRNEKLSALLEAPFERPSANIKYTHLEITKQAWKGLSLVLVRDVSLWGLADFTEVVANKFFDFCEVVIPFIQEFHREQV